MGDEMRRSRRLFQSLTFVSLLFGASLMGPGVASASLGQCTYNDNHICVWNSTLYRGYFQKSLGSIPDVGAGASSLWNRKAHAIYVYSGTGYTGSAMKVAPDQQVSDTPWKVHSIAADPCLASANEEPSALC
ncbi:peptidase inhibitor family I36 protein [Prauserella aidingensis]|uniref:peptidase inhibitor family I36 protein n=1 Tax=Prauserella aidingensis TaxID=387890 RepID=UPI00355730C7